MGYYRRMARRPQAVRLILALALASCQSAPPLPALSPLDQAKHFGYVERDVGPDRVEVTYVGARRKLMSYAPTPRDPEAAAARAEVLDFATWRAAEIARARGFPAFRVVDRQADVDSYPEAAAAGPAWGASPYWRSPGLVYGPPGFYYAVPYVWIQAHAVLTVQLVREPQADDQDAAAAIARLGAAHPGADGPSAPVAPAPSVVPR
jgi:hypothetical protein